LPEALARSQNDSVLSGPARRPTRKGREGFFRAIMRPFLSRPARTIAGAALAAILTGIVVNALVMQKERRSATSVAVGKPAPINTEAPAAPTAASTPPAASAPIVAQPPIRPAHLGAALDPTPQPPPRSGDPIRDLLRGDAAKDATHLTISVQNTLIKLGYALKADGVAGASTTQAIEQFERAHGMTPSGEITPKLVKQLNAAAAAAAR
jgi:hypothetical protein